MKKFAFAALGICLLASAGHAAPISENHAAQIAQVKAGTLKTANASWWGFDKDDATECLQNAISSGVATLIVDNTGSDWIINKPLQMVSNQEIIFSDGVVIQAKKDCFHGNTDSLFSGVKLTNLTLRGEGKAVLRMHKADYQDPAKYSRAEWRMGISLLDCTNVAIRNFTVTQTGGDGLYLGASSSGTNKNIVVEDMNFDDNHRLGMAVISAENLRVRRCKFVNTLGTGPNGGIDFEPNHPGQRLVDCVMEDCVFANNVKGGGIDIYTVNLTGDSAPISITIKNSSIYGNSVGFASTTTRSATSPVQAIITLENCKFDHNNFNLRNALAGSAQYIFKNCTLDYSPKVGDDTPAWKNKPIVLVSDANFGEQAIGGITFDNTKIIADAATPPISLNFQGKTKLSDQIAGTLLVESNGQTKPFDLKAFVAQKQAQLAEINRQKPASVDLEKLRAPKTGAAREGNGEFYVRGKFTFLQYAQKGEAVTINVTTRKVYPTETKVDLVSPSGEKLETFVLPLTNKPFPITFTAEETGLYRVVREGSFSQRIDITSEQPGNGLLATTEADLQFLPIGGRLYFQVPAGVKNFVIGVATDSAADFALLDPSGKEVERQNNVGTIQLLSGNRADASQSEIWSLQVSNAVWAVYVNMYAPLLPIVSTNPATLLLVEK
jgi:hypothetical protein